MVVSRRSSGESATKQVAAAIHHDLPALQNEGLMFGINHGVNMNKVTTYLKNGLTTVTCIRWLNGKKLTLILEELVLHIGLAGSHIEHV